jgi:predicted TIM-barrel fold metal-dependent hydrolase
MLIIDAHAHVFEKIDGMNRHGPVLSSGYGKIKNAGEETPFLLPLCPETAFTSEMLIELMAQNNVGRAVLLQNPTIGTMNDYILRSVRKYPDSFAGTMQVDIEDPRSVNEVASSAETEAFRALKLEMSRGWGWTGIYPKAGYFSENMQHLIEQAVKYGLTIIIDTGPIGNPGYDIESLETITSRYPNTYFLIEHLGYLKRDNLASNADMVHCVHIIFFRCLTFLILNI